MSRPRGFKPKEASWFTNTHPQPIIWENIKIYWIIANTLSSTSELILYNIFNFKFTLYILHYYYLPIPRLIKKYSLFKKHTILPEYIKF
jgi:hypothetical protein